MLAIYGWPRNEVFFIWYKKGQFKKQIWLNMLTTSTIRDIWICKLWKSWHFWISFFLLKLNEIYDNISIFYIGKKNYSNHAGRLNVIRRMVDWKSLILVSLTIDSKWREKLLFCYENKKKQVLICVRWHHQNNGSTIAIIMQEILTDAHHRKQTQTISIDWVFCKIICESFSLFFNIWCTHFLSNWPL